jgi:hypothetical protein
MLPAEKNEELQFYISRAIDSAVMMRSIIHNPRLTADEQVAAIKQIADVHGTIALDLHKSIYGTNVVLSHRE